MNDPHLRSVANGAVLAAIGAFSFACGSGPTATPNPDARVPTTIGMQVAAMHSWPGGGTAITLRVHDADGFPLSTDSAQQIQMRWLVDDSAANILTRPISLPSGHTSVVVIPSTNADAQLRVRDAALAFLGERPADERIALYRWGATIDQLRDFTLNRDELITALNVTGLLAAPSSYVGAHEAVTTVGDENARIGGEWHPGLRSVVFIGADLPEAIPDFAQSSLVQWVVGGVSQSRRDELGSGFVSRPEDAGGDLKRAARTAADRLEAFAATGHHRVAVCGAPTGASARISMEHNQLTVSLPTSLDEEHNSACDAPTILDGQRTFADTIEFQFTSEERAVYDQRYASLSKSDFNLSVVLGPARAPLPSVAHLRGKGSITCERKNFTLNLGGKRARYLMPRSATDEFYLLSMCLDDRYVRQHTLMQLWQQLGLFPFEFRFIELKIDGVSQGVYLLVEKVAEEFRLDRNRIRSVLRRGFATTSPPTTPIEVKYSGTTEQDARDSYAAALAGLDGLSGDTLIEALERRLNLADYLRLLAGASAVENGDYVDEVWLANAETLMSDGTMDARYRFAGWDFEDVLSSCHYSGQFSVMDPWQLTYCAEAEWDHIMLADPDVYARYVDTLEAMLDTTLTSARFKAALDATEAELSRYLRIPGVAPAMTRLVLANPAATDPDIAIQEIRTVAADLATRFDARTALLRQRIAAYRAN